MARSVDNRLSEIEKLRRKAEEMLQRAEQEEEKLLSPTRTKISDLFAERVRAFVRTNKTRLADMAIERAKLSAAFDAFLEANLFAAGGSRIHPDDDAEELTPEA